MKRICGHDVHKDSVYRCILQEKGEKSEQELGPTTKTELYFFRKPSIFKILP